MKLQAHRNGAWVHLTEFDVRELDEVMLHTQELSYISGHVDFQLRWRIVDAFDQVAYIWNRRHGWSARIEADQVVP